MRAVLLPCNRCKPNPRHPAPADCPRCGGFGVLMDVLINPRDRQIIDAWRDEPPWHRAARWRAEAEGRPGFFQRMPTAAEIEMNRIGQELMAAALAAGAELRPDPS